MAAPTVADYLLGRLREWGVDTRLRFSRRRHQRDPRRLRARRQRAEVHPGPARGDERVRGRRLRQVHRPGRGVHGDLRPGRDPPAQRPVRRQAGPRPGRGDRRPDRPQRDGRLLPAGGGPAHPVQGRGQRLPADGHRARAAAQRARPGHADRGWPNGPSTAVIIPSDVQELEYSPPTHAFKMVPSSLGVQWPDVTAGRRRRPAGRRTAERGLQGGHAGRPGRARRRGRGARRWRTCSAPVSPRHCWARTSCPTSCPRSPARSGCSAPGPATR